MKIINSGVNSLELAYSMFEWRKVKPIIDEIRQTTGAEIQTYGGLFKRAAISGTTYQMDVVRKVIKQRYYR
ncbi:hypothetical protein [Budvicia aquatica]|uniref:Uncharacterized protein n=1 Tax=Budvicia aquatica TaxID=82979 RepID=A0A2C6C5A4_9GAMM|nr:hypothetical protein [Budvicia aquatica]PHI31520.1 hypothetical protein CRN84_20340 [Budvicia aquatica]VFS51950.1 Uncharacterised protein [Budvicia aquatica]